MQPIFNPMNNNITSQNLSILEVMELYNPKYNLSESEINKYITAYDNITTSLGCNKYKLTEGITNNKNKYNNILIDLYHQTIPSDIIFEYPLITVFNIKQDNHNNIRALSKSDINKIKTLTSSDMDFYGEITSDNYFYQAMQSYRSQYSNYAGNSYTYYVFKQLIKLFITEVYLYEYQGNILTYSELIDFYNTLIFNNSDPSTIKHLSELLESGKIKKVKYQCIKILEPLDINSYSISDLKLYLIDVNKINNFIESYDTLIEKSFNSFLNSNNIKSKN
jgi:hypothetical protein